jgi:serine protease Do
MDSRTGAFWAQLKAHRFAYTLTVLATLTLGILIGTVISSGVKGKEGQKSDATPLTIPAPQQLGNAFSQIAKQIEPSVVNINTDSTIKNPHRRGRQGAPDDEEGGGGGPDNPFDFFDRFFGGQGGPTGPIRQRSLGSGVIVDPKGYILTNNHVVENADRVRVHVVGEPDTVLHDAKVIGTDRETDLAVIKIDDSKPLPAAKIGNSDGAQVGDWVLAIGSPFGLNATVTAGIISYKGRNNIVPGRQFQSFIQTDAAINPGNSGGPLVNMAGEVVGINTAILTETNSYAGVGFAMPSNTVASVYNQIIANGKVTRGSIGVQFGQRDDPAVAKVYGVTSGVTIGSVVPGSPAEEAGLKTGDTITSIDGKPIKTGDELVEQISGHKPGSKATLGFIRNGKQQEATVTIADRNKLFAARLGDEQDNGSNEEPKPSKFGVTVKNITPEQADRLQLPQGQGVMVTDVKPGSFAEDANLGRGDVILQVNRQPVNSVEEFKKIESSLKSGDAVVFLVRPRGAGPNDGTIFDSGTLP